MDTKSILVGVAVAAAIYLFFIKGGGLSASGSVGIQPNPNYPGGYPPGTYVPGVGYVPNYSTSGYPTSPQSSSSSSDGLWSALATAAGGLFSMVSGIAGSALGSRNALSTTTTTGTASWGAPYSGATINVGTDQDWGGGSTLWA